MGVVPVEIINLIVDQVAQDAAGDIIRAETLRACSLAAKSFLYQCQKHLFTNIQVTIDSDIRKPAGKLAAVYNDNEVLLGKLRSLRLVFDMQDSGEPDFLYDIGLADACSTLERPGTSKLRMLLKLFARARLESLAVVARNGFLNWSRMSRQSQELFLAIRNVPSIHSVQYEHLINLDRGMISREGLDRLALALNIDIPTSSGGPNALPVTSMGELASLTKLEIDHTALFHILPPPWRVETDYLPRLQDLTITLPRDHASRMEVMRFISHVGRQLHSLRLTSVWYPHPDMDISNEQFFGSFQYSDLPNLHHLTFECGPGNSLLSTSFVAVANLLIHAYHVKSMTIKRLDIVVQVFPVALQDLTYDPRVNIDEVLTNSALVERLQDISVHINIHRDPHGRQTEVLSSVRTAEDLRRYFPRTSAHPALHLNLHLTKLYLLS